jgi:hypothetical protein
MESWFNIATDGVFQEGRDGKLYDLLRPWLLEGPRATLIALSEDSPENWLFRFWGHSFGAFESKSFIARRVGDLPATDMVEVTCKGYMEALPERRPVIHRISGTMIDGRVSAYDRLILPVADSTGEIRHIITISDILYHGPKHGS